MSKRKGYADRVHPGMAEQAVRQSKHRNEVWTQYIIVHYRATGSLAPGCDAVDLFAWLDEYGPDEFKSAKCRKL